MVPCTVALQHQPKNRPGASHGCNCATKTGDRGRGECRVPGPFHNTHHNHHPSRMSLRKSLKAQAPVWWKLWAPWPGCGSILYRNPLVPCSSLARRPKKKKKGTDMVPRESPLRRPSSGARHSLFIRQGIPSYLPTPSPDERLFGFVSFLVCS